MALAIASAVVVSVKLGILFNHNESFLNPAHGSEQIAGVLVANRLDFVNTALGLNKILRRYFFNTVLVETNPVLVEKNPAAWQGPGRADSCMPRARQFRFLP